MSKNKQKYVVGAVRCGCHPETCNCNDYQIHLVNGDTYISPKLICTGNVMEAMEQLVKLANKGLKRKKR